MATNSVYQYLQTQNRPYSANDLLQNLNKEYGKTAIQKSLDDLVSKDKIIEKTYGKQKVYCIKQEEDKSNPDEMKEEIAKIDKNINELTENLQRNEQKIKNYEFELKNLLSSLTTEQAKDEVNKLEEKAKELRERLKTLSENNCSPISAEQKSKIETEHTKYMKEYRKRKRICMDIIDSIMEGYPKKKKDLIEELGIETDEEVGCTLGK